jgi:PPK2 family polyphosphate:nucleotide phosphotransferase
MMPAAPADPFRVTKGKGLQLKDFDPGDTRDLEMDKGDAAELLQRGSQWLATEQDMLYAQDRWSLLLIFQAMDAAGKDGTIAHVMSGVNPQGCQVSSFKQPSAEELAHDFLWRYANRLPERGRIGIFNRSYYEEVLVVRVHKELLESQKLPPTTVTKRIWDERLADIAHFEEYLTRQGVIILKFFLNLSRKEQKKRFMERLDRPEKNWKFFASDVRERKYWDDYMQAFEEAIRVAAARPGSWCLRTTSGSLGWSSLQRSSKRLRISTSNIPKSVQRRRRNWLQLVPSLPPRPDDRFSQGKRCCCAFERATLEPGERRQRARRNPIRPHRSKLSPASLSPL